MGVKKKRIFLSFACWENFPRFCCCLLIFFSKLTFSKNYFRNTIRVSNSLDPDQARRYVGPDLGPNYLQSKLADEGINQQEGE